MVGNDLAVAPAPAARGPARPTSRRPRRRRVGHLHVGIHRYAEGRGGVAPLAPPPSSTPSRGCSCGTTRWDPRTGSWPGCRSRSTRPARRCGSPGRTAPAWSRRPARWCAAGWTSGPWLLANDITVVSTVPTLVALWPDRVPGRGPPPHPRWRGLPARDRQPGWPTTGARSGTPTGPPRRPSSRAARGSAPDGPVRIGLPLDGWDLAVVDAAGDPCRRGTVGELIIGGVGLARYLDPDKDAEKYAPMPTLGWDRAYRSGDLVRYDGRRAPLRRPRRRPGQARWPAHRARRGRQRAAPAARRRGAAAAVRQDARPATRSSSATSRWTRPSTPPTALGPAARVAARGARPPAGERRVAARPTPRGRSTATPSRGRCPQGPTTPRAPRPRRDRRVGRGAVARGHRAPPPRSGDDDFFDLGGGSLTAAQIVSRLRSRHPEITVADIYEHPTPGRPRRGARRDGRARVPHRPARAAHPHQDPARAARLQPCRCARSPGCAG